MKLYITDHAEPSVGIFESRYDLDCPLDQNNEPEELDQFKKMAIGLYSEFSFGRVSAIYDFEREKRELEYEQNEIENSKL